MWTDVGMKKLKNIKKSHEILIEHLRKNLKFIDICPDMDILDLMWARYCRIEFTVI